MPEQMDEYQLNSIVSSEIRDSLNHFDQEFSQERIRAMDFYLGEPMGNEVEGRSQVVSTEVSDTIESFGVYVKIRKSLEPYLLEISSRYFKSGSPSISKVSEDASNLKSLE